MDKLQFYQQLQQQISNKFRDNTTDKDEHKIEIFPSLQQNNFYIKYIPNHSQSAEDNDGYVDSIQPLLFFGNMINNQISSLTNNQFTKIQYFNRTNAYLLINDIRVSEDKLSDLKQKLSQFHVALDKSGNLITKNNVKDTPLKMFENILKATRFIINNGTDYTMKSNARDIELASLTKAQQIVKGAINNYKEQKKLHTHHHVSKKDNGPKAHGKVVPGYSSTAGTEYAKAQKKEEERLKAREQANINEKVVKSTKKPSTHKKIDLHGEDVTTIGSFSIPRALVVDKIHSLGGSYKSNLSHKTKLVICDHPNNTKKYQDAKAEGIPFISEKDL